MSARYPYYLLADSAEGAAKERELTGHELPAVQHAMRCPSGLRVQACPTHHAQRHRSKREDRARTEPNRRSIASSRSAAEQELLVDQPYEDTAKVRVSGRFTVESLSPHRKLDEAGSFQPRRRSTSFVSTIVENLRHRACRTRSVASG